MSTPEQRAEWRALAQAATPGEWWVEQHSGILHDGTPSTCAVLTSDEYDMASFGDDEQAMFDAAFIAAAREAVPALLADVDALTQERDSMRLSHQLLAAKFDEACAERDALAAAWAQVVAISDEMNPKQGGPFGGDTNIAAYNMSRVRDVVREWKEAQNAVFE